MDQAVEAAKRERKSSAQASFLNACLRRYLRERHALDAAIDHDPVARWNHPPWWVEQLRREYPDDWQHILAANNTHPPLTLRVNETKTEFRQYGQALHAINIEANPVVDTGWSLATAVPVQRLPGFAEGLLSVQDAGAQRAAELLDLKPGMRVLDACAAPGGKTAHLLELADLDVLALDSDAQRLERVHDTLARLGLRSRTLAADAGDPSAWWDGTAFDAILLDAPCSASGIVRRHPDVRWLRRASDITALARTQARLLDALWPTLKRGGRLLYCTCSVFKAEGQEQIDAFLQRHGDAAPLAEPRSPGHLLPLAENALTREPGASATPAPHGLGAMHDGFFYALIQKN